MTEEIIIDGVNVAECQYLYFAIEDSIIDYKEYPRCSIGEAFTNNACKNSNCYYKQLKRKEQECEELRDELEWVHGIKDKLKAENKELKTEFDNFEKQIKLQGKFIDSLLNASNNSEWLNKSILEDEADAIIEKVESDYIQLKRFKQALQEIKEIAEKVKGYDPLAKQILLNCEVLDEE